LPKPTHLRQSPRLKDFDYLGSLAAHLILVTRGRHTVFNDPRFANICLEALEDSRSKHRAIIHSYSVMPDHVHILVQVADDTSLTKFVRLFKQLSGYRLKQESGIFQWQTSYYDHILRKNEAVIDVARYIWENPVRAGLADVAAAHPLDWSSRRSPAGLKNLQLSSKSCLSFLVRCSGRTQSHDKLSPH
jgi:putative transposase